MRWEELRSLAGQTLLGILVSGFTMVSCLIGLLFGLLAFLFFDNFNLSNRWHLFVLAITAIGPVLAIVGYVRYFQRPTLRLAMVSFLLSGVSLLAVLAWQASASRGLIH